MSGNIGIWLDKVGTEVKLDDTTDVEDDVSRLIDINQAIEQRTFCIDITAEVGDVIDDTATPSLRKATIAFTFVSVFSVGMVMTSLS